MELGTFSLPYYILGLLCIIISCAIGQDNGMAANTSKKQYSNTDDVDLVIHLTRAGSAVDSISIQWNTTDTSRVSKYELSYTKEDGFERTIKIISEHSNDITKFDIDGLESDHTYNVCLTAIVAMANETTIAIEKCENMKTIPLILDQSIIALCVTILVIFALVVAGYVHWRWRKNMDEKKGNRYDRDEDMVGSFDKEAVALTSMQSISPDESPQHYNKPHCSIEDSGAYA